MLSTPTVNATPPQCSPSTIEVEEKKVFLPDAHFVKSHNLLRPWSSSMRLQGIQVLQGFHHVALTSWHKSAAEQCSPQSSLTHLFWNLWFLHVHCKGLVFQLAPFDVWVNYDKVQREQQRSGCQTRSWCLDRSCNLALLNWRSIIVLFMIIVWKVHSLLSDFQSFYWSIELPDIQLTCKMQNPLSKNKHEHELPRISPTNSLH